MDVNDRKPRVIINMMMIANPCARNKDVLLVGDDDVVMILMLMVVLASISIIVMVLVLYLARSTRLKMVRYVLNACLRTIRE